MKKSMHKPENYEKPVVLMLGLLESASVLCSSVDALIEGDDWGNFFEEQQ